MVEELLPGAVSLVPQVDVDERVVPGPDGLLDQRHAGLFRCLAPLPDVARRACADDIRPNRLAPHTPRNNVVQRKLAHRESLAAVLASVFVAGEDVSTIELHFRPRQPIVKKKPNNPGHRNIEIHRRYPVVPVRLELATKLTDLAPALKIIVGIAALFQADHFGKLAT